jgi:hypothetical protein
MTLALIEIVRLEGSKDFVTEADAWQNASGNSEIESVTAIPFTSTPPMLAGISPLPVRGGVAQEANPGGDVEGICTPLCNQTQFTPVPTPTEPLPAAPLQASAQV